MKLATNPVGSLLLSLIVSGVAGYCSIKGAWGHFAYFALASIIIAIWGHAIAIRKVGE